MRARFTKFMVAGEGVWGQKHRGVVGYRWKRGQKIGVGAKVWELPMRSCMDPGTKTRSTPGGGVMIYVRNVIIIFAHGTP